MALEKYPLPNATGAARKPDCDAPCPALVLLPREIERSGRLPEKEAPDGLLAVLPPVP